MSRSSNWPKDIQEELVSDTNKKGTLTVNDLEMAGLLLQTLVLEHLVTDLKHQHAAAWVDNTSAVSWANKLAARQTKVAGRLLRTLALRMRINEASPMVTLSIAGKDNGWAGGNNFRGCSPEFDELFAQLTTTPVGPERDALITI